MDTQAAALANLRPKLFHVTSAEAYQAVFDQGLLSTANLLGIYGWSPTDIEAIITHPRADFVPITSAEHPSARLSHQRPINLTMLRKCLELTATSEADYFRFLATRVFFFPTTGGSSGFLAALLAAGPVDILTINTFALLRSAGTRVEVSCYNSGSSPRSPLPKGRETWVRLDQFDRKVSEIKEITVLDRVDDVETLTVSVVRVNEDGARKRLWP